MTGMMCVTFSKLLNPQPVPASNPTLVINVPRPVFATFKKASPRVNNAEISCLSITLFARSWKSALRLLV